MNNLRTAYHADEKIVNHPGVFMHPSPQEIGVEECAFSTTDQLLFSDQTRTLCQRNSCGQFNATWACPPAVGSHQSCVMKCLSYKNVMIFSTVADLKGRYNVRGWHEARVRHETVTDRVAQQFRTHRPDSLVLSTEGCLVCDRCTYPDEPCRYPDKLFPSVEGYGIIVMDIVIKTGLSYTHGPETLTYFSFILF